MRRSAYERFYLKVQINEQTNCWEWIGSLTKDGYGQFRLNGRVRAAHQVSWEWCYVRPVPSKMEIDHVCRVRHCVNPNHLQLEYLRDYRQRENRIGD